MSTVLGRLSATVATRLTKIPDVRDTSAVATTGHPQYLRLLRVKLDDELLLQRHVDLCTLGLLVDEDA